MIECPAPSDSGSKITLAHGGGGRLSQRLFEEVLFPAFHNPMLGARHDGATFATIPGKLAFSTDAHVVAPLVFPGGDIGKLAVFGTCNDLAMCGAQPRYLSLSLILEEGLEIATLRAVVDSISQSAREAQVLIVTGDTKVVEKGRCEGMYVTVSGIGEVRAPALVAPSEIRTGDAILVSGDLGRHGIAVLSAREGFRLETSVRSDCADLWPSVNALLEAKIPLRCLRDLTRGGLAAAATEIAQARGLDLTIDEPALRVEPSVRGACEILGLDPIHIPNEGRFMAIVPKDSAAMALAALTGVGASAGAYLAGEVIESSGPGRVWVRTAFGQRRLLVLPSGEQLPRIC